MSILDGIKGDGDIQTEKRISVKEDTALAKGIDEVMESYAGWLAQCSRFSHFEEDYLIATGWLKDRMISRVIFDEFCLRLGSYQRGKHIHHSGPFISALVQSAYDQGCNDFLIRAELLEKEMPFLGVYLLGAESDPLRIKIDGDVGSMCGYLARYSEFTIAGDAGTNCGKMARDCRFTLYGGITYGCGWCALSCTFSSPDRDVLKAIKDSAQLDCRFYLIDADGSMEVLR